MTDAHQSQTASGNSVEQGDRIALRYAIRLRNSPEDYISNFDETEADIFTLGDGTLTPTMEQWLIGVAPGERHVFLLDPWQAFGMHSEEMIQTLDPQDIPTGMEIEADTLMEFDLPNGQTMVGTILTIEPGGGIRVDFNHPLAGCAIEFEAEVERILNKATA